MGATARTEPAEPGSSAGSGAAWFAATAIRTAHTGAVYAKQCSAHH